MATAFKHAAPAAPLFKSAAQFQPLYAMHGKGDCMEPIVMDGTCLVFGTAEKPVPGDLVCLWFKPGRNRGWETQCIFKRLLCLPDALGDERDPEDVLAPMVVLEMVNPRRRFLIPASDVLAVHKWIGTAEDRGNGFARLTAKTES